GIFNYEPGNGESTKKVLDIPNHNSGIHMVLEALTNKETGVIENLNEINAVGHRIVHGGEKIQRSVLLTPDMIKDIEACIPLAPLHNPANLMGIEAVKAELPNVPHVGVFDTAFHATIPEQAFIYGLDYEYYEKHGIRRFGFHGTSHQYVSMRAAEILGVPQDEFNCITCHMGNGVSFSAVKNGQSIDTSLGFGTMCGIPMGTRAGDVDPAAILHLIDNLGLSTAQVHDLIYKNGGLKGISGVSSDMRDIEKAAAEGNKRAQLALDVFAHAARKFIGAYATEMGGKLNAIIFTAGIGENAISLRESICEGLEILGAKIDSARNDVRGKETIVSTDDSRVKILVVPTNEELMIALDTQKIALENA
ncbi:MAG: acetate kinase, partial [Spirochaetaceae bacterium]